jgi:tetratricopeptide (TPR) repeat protein
LIGAEGELADISRMYTAAQVSRIVEEPLSVVRGWLRRGLLHPARVANRLAWFEFKDILLARTLRRLTSSGVSTAHVRHSLSQIAQWLPDGEQIVGRLEAYDRGLRIRMTDGGWAEPSGQRLMDFESEDERRSPRVSVFPDGDQNHGRWFSAAVQAEERGDLQRAADAYGRALESSADAETLFNLGNVLYELGREADAAERYLQAIDADRGFAEAWNNLGNSLVALGKLDDAIHAYQTALSLEPSYPDAHCNLATIFERVGQRDKAPAHRAECLRAFPSETHLTLLRYQGTDDPDD